MGDSLESDRSREDLDSTQENRNTEEINVQEEEGRDTFTDSGLFKLKPTQPPMIFNGESPAPPVFRGPRNSRVSSIFENLIVIGLTIITLAAFVSVFLYINKDLPDRPPPPPIRF